MSWILNKKQILKIITKHANKCSVIFFSILNTLLWLKSIFSSNYLAFNANVFDGKILKFTGFCEKIEMSWKMWHCSLFLLLAYNVLTEKKKENKILGKKTKSFLLHCLLWVRFKRKNRRRKTRKKTFFAFFRSL